MEEVIDIRTLQCYQKATEEQRKKCTSKLSFEIGKLPTLKLQEEWTFYIKHCGEVKSLSSVRQETVYFKRVCEFMNHLSVDSMKVQTKAVWGQQFESWVSAQGLKAYRESNKNKNWKIWFFCFKNISKYECIYQHKANRIQHPPQPV